jgi:uncharacterized protein (TIGR03083 family)
MIAAVEMSTPIQRAADIPKLTHQEASRLSQTEYERVLALLEQLSASDWEQPTYCTAWNVRQMTAHLAGSMTGSTSLAEFYRQNIQHPYVKAAGVDGTNRLQIEERANKTTAELVAEFRQNGQIAIHNRRNLPWLLRKVHAPMGILGFTSFEYLLDTIYPRDEWMHRYDICAATGKQMVTTAEHDGRLVALVLRDIARKLKTELSQRTIAVHLSGAAGGDYLFGRSPSADCILAMDLFDFILRTSGRITAAKAAGAAHISGNRATADWFLANIEVPY